MAAMFVDVIFFWHVCFVPHHLQAASQAR